MALLLGAAPPPPPTSPPPSPLEARAVEFSLPGVFPSISQARFACSRGTPLPPMARSRLPSLGGNYFINLFLLFIILIIG